MALIGDGYIETDYVDGSQQLNHDLRNKFVYRPDERIFANASTHSPKDGAPLISWRSLVNDEETDAGFPDEESTGF